MIDKESKEKFDLLKEIREQKEKFDLLKEIREQEEQEITKKFQDYIQTRYGTQYDYGPLYDRVKITVDHESERYKDRFEDFKKRLENGEDYDDMIRKARIPRSLSIIGELLICATYIACLVFCGSADNFLAMNFLEKILAFTTICLISLFWIIKY